MKIDRSMGDVHPLGNPHYWLDPYNGRIIAQNICRRLKQLDPDHADDYERNLAAFLLKLDSAMFGSKLVKYNRRRAALENAIRWHPRKLHQGLQRKSPANQTGKSSGEGRDDFIWMAGLPS